MRQGKRSFRHESLQDCESIREILKSVTKGIGNGRVVFSDEDGEIIMEPEGLLRLKLTASQEDNLYKMNIRITWQAEEEAPKKKKTLKVSSK
jgi:amphi-Trp domain-containing protein